MITLRKASTSDAIMVRRWTTERLQRTEKACVYLLTLSDAIRPDKVKEKDRIRLAALRCELARRRIPASGA